MDLGDAYCVVVLKSEEENLCNHGLDGCGEVDERAKFGKRKGKGAGVGVGVGF